MLEIHFTSADLGRTRLASGPDHLWETVNAVQLLQHRAGRLIFDGWRATVRDAAEHGPADGAIRALTRVAPHAAYFPDFLTPAATFDSLEAGIDAVLRTPREQLHAELTTLAGYRPLPRWAAGLAAGEPETLRRLGTTISEFHRTAIAPFLTPVTAALTAEHARRTDLTMRYGVERMLASFEPLMRWHPPVLRMPYPIHRTMHLHGRGLRLVPSFFCWHHPVALANPALDPTLVYPIPHLPGWTTHPSATGSGLTTLLGSTRAAVLDALQSACSTSRVARLVGISPATASHHATVLRDANLITSHRDGNTMLHKTTPLGLSLLDANRS